MDSQEAQTPGGIVHTYQKYDPVNFPSPTAPPPDMVSPLMNHMLEFGDTDEFTEEQLRNAIHIDASQIAGLGPSLNAIKQRSLERGRSAEVRMVERFQNPEDRPYSEEYGAVALLSSSVFDKNDVGATTTVNHPHASKLTLIIIHGRDLMPLVHELYRRAADEA